MSVEIVDLTPTLVAGSVRWQMCYTNKSQCEPAAPYPTIDLAYNSQNNLIVFQIVNDQTGLDIKFANDPIWIQPNNKPQAPVVNPHSQIKNVMPGGGKSLAFIDENTGNPMLLKYRLNFQDKDHNAVTAIDPDIHNGGGTNLYSYSATQLIGGAVVLLAAGLLLRPLVDRIARALFKT